MRIDNPYENCVLAVSRNRYVDLVASQAISNLFYDASLRERLAIYQAYYDELNWRGNRQTGQESSEMRYHAHSLYLQIAYFYGIPAGGILIMISIALAMCDLKKIMKFKSNPYIIIPFFICIIFFVSGLMNVVWNTGQLMLFMLFFTQFPIEKIGKI